ncbi:MAG TPA: hypothetical protein VGD21_13470 [Lysobacter sp.]
MPDRNGTDAPSSLVVGVTGHRHLRAAEIPVLQEQVRAFLIELQARYPDLPLVLLSSLAEGTDQLAAQVAFDLGLRVVAPLPMPAELYRDDFSDAGRVALFEHQRQHADVLTLPLRPGSSLEAIAHPGPARDQQYAQAGIFVSSHCHILLALWDGHDSDKLGGTAQVVRFHLQGEMPGQLERRRRMALAQLGLDEDTVVFHIPASRDGSEESLLSQGCWLTYEQDIVAHDELPEGFDLLFRGQAEFNVDSRKYAEAIAADVVAAPDACPIHRLFGIADWLARTYQRRVSHVLRITYVLAALMGFAFFSYTHIASRDVVIYLFLALFLTGMGVVLLTKRRQWQRKYLDYRALAEGLRVQSYWRRAGIVDLNTHAFAHDNFLQKQDEDLGWIRNVMRSASLEGMLVPAEEGAPQVDAVISEWIGTPEGGGQLGYFSVTAERRERLHRRAELLGLCCLWFGVGVSAVLAIFARQFDAHLKDILVAAMGIASVAAAVHEAYAYKKADKELIKQYRFMLRIFNAARRRLSTSTGAAEKRQVLHTLGEAALAEHAEWTLMHRARPVQHSRL